LKVNKVSPPEALERKVRDFLTGRGFVGVETRLLVGVSGGPDSVCLLHILARLREELNFSLHIAHLDHGLRGAESEADARYVARLAKKLEIPATIEKRDVASFRASNKLSLEEAARAVRYRFFAEIAHGVGADNVAVAHTGNDHIETILMHLIRGSGVRGLQGLQPVNRWSSGGKSVIVVRPLLDVRREETVAYCRALSLKPRADSSNLSMSPFRNRVRLELLPLLIKYNPKISDALQRTASQATEMTAFLDNESRRIWDKVVRQEDEGFLLDKREFLKVTPVLQKSVLLLMLEKLLGNLTKIESRHIEEIISAFSLPAGRKLDLPGDLVFTVDYDSFVLSKHAAVLMPLPPLEGEAKLKIPGETRFSEWTVTASILDGTNESLASETFAPKPDGFTAYIDFDKVGKGLTVRGLKAGDIFQPLGMAETKKVARFMLDARIPRSWRDRVPIVSSPDQKVWVAGWRIDERVKITESTRNPLRLQFKTTT
jgi:tRNA(Ile)-lysidine synthase